MVDLEDGAERILLQELTRHDVQIVKDSEEYYFQTKVRFEFTFNRSNNRYINILYNICIFIRMKISSKALAEHSTTAKYLTY